MSGPDLRSPQAAFNHRRSLGALAAVLSEFESPQIRAALTSQVPPRAERDGAQCIALAGTVRLDRPALNHIFALPGGLLFHAAPPPGEWPVASIINPETRAVSTWAFPFRPFSYFVDPVRDWIWTVEELPARLHAFDTEGTQRAELALPAEHGGERFVPRYATFAGEDILLGYFCGGHGVMRITPGQPACPPVILLERLPHTERLYWDDGLLVSQHINPNSMLIHSISQHGGALLRVVPLRGEPLTLARLDQGCLVSTTLELLLLDADYRPQWSADIATLGDWKLEMPSVTEAGGGHAWLKGRGSDTLYKISPTL